MGIITVAVAANATRSKKIVEDFACDASLATGDWVYLDAAVDNKVIKAANNSSPRPVIGVVETKRNATIASVLLLGLYGDGYTFTRGDTVYLGTDGLPTTTPPATGIIQVLGIAEKTDGMLVRPELRRTRRV